MRFTSSSPKSKFYWSNTFLNSTVSSFPVELGSLSYSKINLVKTFYLLFILPQIVEGDIELHLIYLVLI